ncbi:MAG: 5-formyltetrahydrofolate cyclo-ligase [Desulfitobacterium hafniense]|nr:5-formyltetrahydrofolate cyclo-ligase [Desulfitobacterium hafniense]
MSTEKKELRSRVLSLRSALSPSDRAEKSKGIIKNLLDLPEFNKTKTVMSFMSFGDEVDTTEVAEAVLAMEKVLILPRCASERRLHLSRITDLDRDLEAGMWGIREPKKSGLEQVDPSVIDLVVVPGVAFDLQGNRLGYGGGYYDRFLKLVNPSAPRIALAFEIQIVSWLPVDNYDEKITALLTEKGVYRF